MQTNQSMGSRIARGASWMLFFRLTDRVLGFVSTIVLARALAPADFGLVAMAMSVIALIELSGAFSLEVGLIQRPHPTREEYDTTWTLRLLFGLFGALATASVAWVAADFYSDDRLIVVLIVLAANWLAGTFENIGVVDFRRELTFAREYVFLISKRLVSLPITLGMALMWHTYWALIAGTVAGTLMTVLLSYVMHPYRPRFSLKAWRALMSFSIWLFLNNLLAFLQLRLSHFIIGHTQGAESLGIYTVATDFAALATSEITAPVNRAVMPGLARMAGSMDTMRRGLQQVISAVLLVTLPAAFGMAAVAEPMVLTLLGYKWPAAAPVLQILCFSGAMLTITANNHSAYLAAGKSQVPAFVNAVFVVALIPLLFALERFGVIGIALAQLGAMTATMTASIVLMRHYLGVRLRDLAGAVWRPLLAAAVMGLAVYGLDQYQFGLKEAPAPIVRLLVGMAVGVVLYVAMVATLWLMTGRGEGLEKMVFERARALVQRAAH
jgi:lipopolysaccharide exporter